MSFTPTITRFLSLPPLRKRDDGVQGFYIAACGITPDWRGCVVSKSLDGGQSWEAVATIRTPSTMGRVLSCDAPGEGVHYPDGKPIFSITVRTTHIGQQLESHAADTVEQGANRIAIGGEVLSYEVAQLIAPHTYRLSGITRARKSTEASRIYVGDAFTSLHTATLARVDLLDALRGEPALYRSASFGQAMDDEPILTFEQML